LFSHAGHAATATPTGAVYGPFPKLANALTTTPVVIKASGGQLAWVACSNGSNATAFIQAFDTAGAVTLGMTVPKFIIPIRIGTEVTPLPATFVAGLKVAATTTATGMSAPSAALDCSFGII
jgi:hypothetical protein